MIEISFSIIELLNYIVHNCDDEEEWNNIKLLNFMNIFILLNSCLDRGFRKWRRNNLIYFYIKILNFFKCLYFILW